MGYIRYFPEDNTEKSKKLKEMIEEDFRKLNKKFHKKLKAYLNYMNEEGASYVFEKMKEERGCKHSNKTIVEIDANFYELRVPKQSKMGVFRVYFTIYPDRQRIMILDAEYKTEKKPKRLESAKRKLDLLRKEVGWK
ncbi:MAG: hypothetical protein DRH12_18245 [Deltaproteobacteria bacterium]|nr:MAG: hypothetical protein DRH12_18245 [Deltaproteobacteria bacterium]